jgi:phage gp36-like protein
MPETFYCEIADLKGVGVSEQKLIQLTNGTDYINQDIFDTARRSATAQVNGFAMTRYSGKIPFNPVPDAIRTIAAILTAYYLYPRSSVPKEIADAYKEQISILKMLANGTFKLEQDDTPVTEDSVQFTNKKPEDRAFHLDNMPGYLP